MASDNGAEALWSAARNYVNRREKMTWDMQGRNWRPTFLEVFVAHIEGDAGGISNDPQSHGISEPVDVTVIESGSCVNVVNLTTVEALHEYLLKDTDVSSRAFLVNCFGSGVCGLLGARFNLDPEMFTNHMVPMVPDYARLPSSVARNGFTTLRYNRSDENDAWRSNAISVAEKTTPDGCSNTIILYNDHILRINPGLDWKLFEPFNDGDDTWSVRQLFGKQFFDSAQDREPSFSTRFAALYTAFTVVINEMSYLLYVRERLQTQLVNALNSFMWAVTPEDKAEQLRLVRTLSPSVYVPGLPEGLVQMVDNAKIARQQFNTLRPSFNEPDEADYSDLTSQDLTTLEAFAEKIATMLDSVTLKAAAIFGSEGIVLEEVPTRQAVVEQEPQHTVTDDLALQHLALHDKPVNAEGKNSRPPSEHGKRDSQAADSLANLLRRQS